MDSRSNQLEDTLQLGIQAVKQGENGQALKHLTAVLKARPDHIEALHWFAQALPNAQDRYRIYHRILSLEPSNEQAMLGLRQANLQLSAEAPSLDDQAKPLFGRNRWVMTGALATLALIPIFAGIVLLVLILIQPRVGWLAIIQADSQTEQATSTLEDYFGRSADGPPTSSAQGIIDADRQMKAYQEPLEQYILTSLTQQTSQSKPLISDWDLMAQFALLTKHKFRLSTPEPSMAEMSIAQAPLPLPNTLPMIADLPTMSDGVLLSEPRAVDEASLAHQPAYPGEKWIEVNTTTQEVIAWEGNLPVMSFVVSTGLPNTPTLPGKYRIYWKLTATRMVGPGYNLPSVPYTMYYYKGYALHGAYWHDNFGQPMSHGCVNFTPDHAKTLFEWADPILPPGQTQVTSSANNPGTLVVVHN